MEYAKVIKGSDVAARLRENIKTVMEEHFLKPVLAVIRVGNDASDLAYQRGIAKTCENTGIDMRVFEFPLDICQDEFELQFRRINEDPSVDGILLFRPLPPQLDNDAIASWISPEKDMDCMSPVNWAKLITGDFSGYFPCTAEAVIQILDAAGVDCTGARAVVLGRSQVIGKPVGLMLLAKNATVTWCHTKTKDLAAMCKDAEILVSACGAAGLVDETIARGISPSCIAVDVGVKYVNGKMQGDFDFEAVSKYAAMITPVPGGVGAVTNTILAAHVLRAAYKKTTGKDLLL